LAESKNVLPLKQRHQLAASHGFKEDAESGGLWPTGRDKRRQFGSRPPTGPNSEGVERADLRVEQPTKFEQVIDFKTAKALGLQSRRRIVARADEGIE
jgi:putative ABC transport system substrate-binding protein